MATLNADLKTALTLQSGAGYAQLANIVNGGVVLPLAPIASRSIHVPLYKDGAGACTQDSCITITTLLNQWDVYTRDHTAGVGGILSGFNFQGAALENIAPYLFISIFGGIDEALHFFNAVDADIAGVGGAQSAALAGAGYFQPMIATLTAIRGARLPAPAAYAAVNPAPPLELTDGWSDILNAIAAFHPDAEKTAAAGETYDPPVAGAAPVINRVGGRLCLPPSDLIRYAFGLLWRIKTVLGDSWPDTHRQMTTGGKKKSSRFTHRKKQYSQRRYKK